MDALIPWEKLEPETRRYYAGEKTGRPLYPLSVMLRIHCLQLFYEQALSVARFYQTVEQSKIRLHWIALPEIRANPPIKAEKAMIGESEKVNALKFRLILRGWEIIRRYSEFS